MPSFSFTLWFLSKAKGDGAYLAFCIVWYIRGKIGVCSAIYVKVSPIDSIWGQYNWNTNLVSIKHRYPLK